MLDRLEKLSEHRQGERWDVHRSMHAEISLSAGTLTLRQMFRY
jgi:hypothetical protein